MCYDGTEMLLPLYCDWTEMLFHLQWWKSNDCDGSDDAIYAWEENIVEYVSFPF